MTLRDRFCAHPVLWAWAVIFAAEAAMNTIFGHRFGGPLYASFFLAFAVLGCWAADRAFDVRGASAAAWRARALYGVPTVLCIALSQFSGWSVMGVTVSDGIARRAVAGDMTQNLRDQIQMKKDALAKRASLAAPNEIEAAIAAELGRYIKKASGTIGQATKDCAEPAWAPTACKRVNELKAQLAAASNAAALPGEIAALEQQMITAGVTGGPEAQFEVLKNITGWKMDQIKFWVSIFIVAMVGLFSNLGLAIVGGRPFDAAAAEPNWTHEWGPPRLSYQPHRGAPPDVPPPPYDQPITGRPGPGRNEDFGYDAGGRRAAGVSPAPSTNAAPSHGGNVHGAPITINLGGLSGAGSGAGGRLPEGLSPAPSQELPAAHGASGFAHQMPALETGPAFAPLPPSSPVDRSALNAMIDNCLAFRAACAIDQAGAVVAAGEMYQRYREWAGVRAVDAGAFHTIFAALTGLEFVLFGGVHHYAGVALKREPMLAAVNG